MNRAMSRWLTCVPGALALASTMVSDPPLAHAQQPDCADWDNLHQQGMNQCAHIAYQEADAELNRIWQELRERHGEGRPWDMILEAQRAWIPFRDAHCEAEATPWEGGSMQPFIRSTCLSALTEHRTAQLRTFLNEP